MVEVILRLKCLAQTFEKLSVCTFPTLLQLLYFKNNGPENE